MNDTTRYFCLRCREVHRFRLNGAGHWECTGCGQEPKGWVTDGKRASYELPEAIVADWRENQRS